MDEQLRRLERTAAASGAASDQAAVLAERVRYGILTQERLSLAAYCGDQAARLVVGLPFVVDNQQRTSSTKGFRAESWSAIDDDTIARWAHGLTFWDDRSIARGLVIGARAALHAWARRFGVRKREDGTEETIADGPCGDARCCPHSSGPPPCEHPDRRNPRLAIEAVENWLTCPVLKHCEDCARRFSSFPEIVISVEVVSRDTWWEGPLLAAMCINADTAACMGWTSAVVEPTALEIDKILGGNAKTVIGRGLSAWTLRENA